MVLALSDFWTAFFLLLIWVPLALLWICALLDIFRRDDIGGFAKALWVLVIIFVPWFGALIYLITRPFGATPQERAARGDSDYPPPTAAV